MTIVKDTFRPFINKIVALLMLTYVQKVIMVCYSFSFVGAILTGGNTWVKNYKVFLTSKKSGQNSCVCDSDLVRKNETPSLVKVIPPFPTTLVGQG